MKFEIYRTSDWCRENKPCEGAKLVRAGSAEHKPVYEIEINTLEQLLELVDEINDIIVMDSDKSKTGYKYEIELYDDYRE